MDLLVVVGQLVVRDLVRQTAHVALSDGDGRFAAVLPWNVTGAGVIRGPGVSLTVSPDGLVVARQDVVATETEAVAIRRLVAGSGASGQHDGEEEGAHYLSPFTIENQELSVPVFGTMSEIAAW